MGGQKARGPKKKKRPKQSQVDFAKMIEVFEQVMARMTAVEERMMMLEQQAHQSFQTQENFKLYCLSFFDETVARLQGLSGVSKEELEESIQARHEAHVEDFNRRLQEAFEADMEAAKQRAAEAETEEGVLNPGGEIPGTETSAVEAPEVEEPEEQTIEIGGLADTAVAPIAQPQEVVGQVADPVPVDPASLPIS